MGILHDKQLSAKLDALFDVGRDFAQTLLATWLASRSDQGEASTQIERETGPAPIPTDKRELSVKELATLWGVDKRSVYQWKDTHGLPYKRVGRLLRFDWIEADQWSKRHRESFTKARLRIVK